MLKCQIIEEEFEAQVRYLTYKGSLTHYRQACTADEEYKMVKYKYRKLVTKYFPVESNTMINNNDKIIAEGIMYA